MTFRYSGPVDARCFRRIAKPHAAGSNTRDRPTSYALLPTRIAPIWGLEWTTADGAPAFVTRREVTPEIRQAFIAMLLGR